MFIQPFQLVILVLSNLKSFDLEYINKSIRNQISNQFGLSHY